MSPLRSEIRRGAYHDSIVLMQLQAALADLPGVLDAAAVMGARENLAILDAAGMLPEGTDGLFPEDLLVVVRAEDASAASEALARVDALLSRRRAGDDDDFRPRTIASAADRLPEARVALISVPGRFAARVAREAIEHDLDVFLYSDNVSVTDEVALKTEARARGRLVMGPDCGTANLNGVGLGFANRVRRGPIGLVGASGTGLQALTCGVHALGSGVSHAIGTGGRDLSGEVGGITTLQALDLLARDPATRVIGLISKPPDPDVARALLDAVGDSAKPVVFYFLGFRPPVERVGAVRYARSLGHAAALAVELSKPGGEASALSSGDERATDPKLEAGAGPGAGQRYLRGLFSGGTLAYEALARARGRLRPLRSNIPLDGVERVGNPATGGAHTVLDLGSDEYTIGRLHPMMDNTLRLQLLEREAADPEVGAILIDVVLGDGAHPDPAGEFAPIIETARGADGPDCVAIVVGTEEDPQDLDAQVSALAEAGAHVFRDVAEAVDFACRRLGAAGAGHPAGMGDLEAGGREPPDVDPGPPVDLDVLSRRVAAINVGVEVFWEALRAQDAEAIHVDWRPPAGGDERLMSLLDKMRS